MKKRNKTKSTIEISLEKSIIKKIEKMKERMEELGEEFTPQINSVTCGDIAVASTTESLDKVMACMDKLIKNYIEFNELKMIDKLKKGNYGIG